MIVDRRAKWYADTAPLRAADPGSFLCRYEAGRKVQARIVAADLTRERLLRLGAKPAPVVEPAPMVELATVVEFKRRGRG